jgi:hypothetical protein
MDGRERDPGVVGERLLREPRRTTQFRQGRSLRCGQVTTHDDRHACREIRLGRIAHGEASERPPLRVLTGIDDDLRREVRPDNPLYGVAEDAWLYQDEWSLDGHRSFWIGVLPLWPKQPGHRQQMDTLAWWYDALRRHGLTDAEIADVLGYDPDTLRRYRLADRAEMLRHERIERPPLREREPIVQEGVVVKPDVEPLPPLPRVYSAREEEPEHSWVNLPLRAMANVRPRDALAIEYRASQRLRESAAPA